MKHLLFFAMIASAASCLAQTAIDNFNVGPYVVDYNGNGDVKYRLRDNIDLYEFFELQKDTTIISEVQEIEPLRHAILISGKIGSNRYSSKEIGLEGVWKQNIATNLYFNAGLSFTFGLADYGEKSVKRNMFEVGIPLQLELGRFNSQKASLYGLFGITPVVYSTMSATVRSQEQNKRIDGVKKSVVLKKDILILSISLDTIHKQNFG